MEVIHDCFFHLHPIFEPLMVLYIGAFFLDDFTEMIKIRIGIYSGEYKERFNKRREDLKDKLDAAIRYHNSRLRDATENAQNIKDGFKDILKITTKIKVEFEDLITKLNDIKLNIPKTTELLEKIRELKFKTRFLFFSLYVLFILLINGFPFFWNIEFFNQLIIFNQLFLGFYFIYFISSFRPQTRLHNFLNNDLTFAAFGFLILPLLAHIIYKNISVQFFNNNLHLALNISCLCVSILPFPFAFGRVLLSRAWRRTISESIINTKIKVYEDDYILKREELRTAWNAWTQSATADESLKNFLSMYKSEEGEKSN